jgi:hypothetical protein
LGQDCSDPEGFDSRLSALAQAFNSFDPPTDGERGKTNRGATLERLRQYLLRRLPEESHAVIDTAVATLKSAMRIRAGGQHSAVMPEAAKKFAEFDIRYPPADWGAAWNTVRTRITRALDSIREELQAQRSA